MVTRSFVALACFVAAMAAFCWAGVASAQAPASAAADAKPVDAKDGGAGEAALAGDFTEQVRPLLKKYCFECHSTAKHKGDLDLERFEAAKDAHHDAEVWRAVLEMLESGQMPPEDSPQPTAAEHRRLAGWTGSLLESEILSRAGDPGRVIVRRLSNPEYNYTIRDLTGLDLQPTRDFPADGAAGEGFTNSGDGLVMSPVLLGKYWNAGKEIASHAVLTPDGFRFSPALTRADQSQELITKLRTLYHQYNRASGGTDSGRLEFAGYLAATITHRDKLLSGAMTIDQLAESAHLNPKYLGVLWQTLTEGEASLPLSSIRAAWRACVPENSDTVANRIRTWQALAWKFDRIGSYVNPAWQVGVDPTLLEQQTLKAKPKPATGKNEVVLYLSARDVNPGDHAPQVVWQRPRFEAPGRPLILLRDLRQVGGRFEALHRDVFASTAKYLAASLEMARDATLTPKAAAERHGLDLDLLGRWNELTSLSMGMAALEPLSKAVSDKPALPTIAGWGTDTPDELPQIVGNSADESKAIPGRILPHQLAVHPSPSHFVAVIWNSPIEGRVRLETTVVHAHPPGGNGVVWWLEHRHGGHADRAGSDAIGSGQPASIAPLELAVVRGSQIVLAIGPRGADHNSDLTDVDMTITELEPAGRTWNLGRDVADTIRAGNPHADQHGNAEVWQFARGLDSLAPIAQVPVGSRLAVWRTAAHNGSSADELAKLADSVQALLTGERPGADRMPDQQLYDNLQSARGPLLEGLDTSRFSADSKTVDSEPASASRFGLASEQFGPGSAGSPADENSVVMQAPGILELHVPANVFEHYEFVTEAALSSASGENIVQVEVSTEKPNLEQPAREARPCLRGSKVQLSPEGLAAFRRCFPVYLYYPKIVPDDETICLRMYYREDDQFCRLMIGDEEKRELDKWWAELRYVSQFPIAEQKYYSTFMGFVSQDGPDEYQRIKNRIEEPVRRRGEEFAHETEELAPAQVDALVAFTARVYRRPLAESEQTELKRLYQTLRDKKEMSHEDAWRTTLASLFTSPLFLYRIESAPPGSDAQPVSNWELATRLSYFLWASLPDAELQQVAAAGTLTQPTVLSAQTNRMLRDGRVRGLATEFATQWLHVRDIRNNREKNEKLFPSFDDSLREALFEESTRFFQNLFQEDRSVLEIFDADYTFVNETLARHYGIPGVTGPEWRRVEGIKKYGRGGVLALGSVLAAQSGASRTSPVLRGNWLVETLLGEKTPKPPANVPRLPDEETGGDNLTVRQMVEQHARVAECAVCHERIDPFGFALEKYDAIGRLREVDLAGRPIATDARLKDGTQFDGLDGLRKYLIEQRKALMLRHFCTKLLGYSLGRTVSLSDRPLVDEMVAELEKNDYRFSAAVLPIVRSKQFCNHRGMDATKDE
ncbi:MAG TPA: DUF1592 domain-containing protein [Pirellulales bacterium]|nr:DUF1592 domain-containing protein [Pirellulales bacterium]